MQIDVVLIGKDKLHQAQGVLRPRLLPHHHGALRHLLRGVVGLHGTFVVSHLEVHARQIAMVRRHVRNQLLTRNIDRYVPIGTEDEVLHHVCKHRRPMLSHHLADHDAHGEIQLVVRIVAAQNKLRQVHHQACMKIRLG